jgi:hypothetical protein
MPGQVNGRGGQEGQARDDGHQRRDSQRRLVGQPAPVQQGGARVAERAEYHGPGTEEFHCAAAQIDAQQRDHADEPDD